MIVVDVNVLVYLFTDVPERAQAAALFERDPAWRVPRLWRSEFLNVLATLVRNDYLEQADAIRLWERASAFCKPLEMEPDLMAALDLSLAHGISGYDAQYLALAEQLGVVLVSNDRKLIQRAHGRALSLKEALGRLA